METRYDPPRTPKRSLRRTSNPPYLFTIALVPLKIYSFIKLPLKRVSIFLSLA